MKTGTPHFQAAVHFRRFLEDKEFRSPSEFHRDLVGTMGKYAPSLSTIWMAFYGARLLPLETLLFMRERYGFKMTWRDALPTRNAEGVDLKRNQLSLPGMREIKR